MGDSQIIINLLRIILNGANPDKMSPSWRLSHRLQIITDLLQPNEAVILAHIRRKANQVADELSNMGTNWSRPKILCNTALEPDHPILQHCIHKAGTMDTPPDGVLVRNTWREEEEWIDQPGTKPCDKLVPSPTT
jgi:hypothetical protein